MTVGVVESWFYVGECWGNWKYSAIEFFLFSVSQFFTLHFSVFEMKQKNVKPWIAEYRSLTPENAD
jgi:hypothetical protein